MLTPFDPAILILLVCLALLCRRVPFEYGRIFQIVLIAMAGVAVISARLLEGGGPALDFAAAIVLACAAVAVGRQVIARRTWPERAFAVALLLVTATGAYLRGYRLDDVVRDRRPLQPDVVYYHQQAQRTTSPFAAGYKSPLWPALIAPLLRIHDDPNITTRIPSWCCGVAMLPLCAWSLGRLLHPIAGIATAGMLAVQPWVIDLCCEGLREEAGVCLWMVTLFALFSPTIRAGGTRQVLLAGVLGGLLLLLRNTFVVPLFAVMIWGVWYNRWRAGHAATALLLPILIVSPFYINQYRTWGDAFALEKRDTRYHANLEFQSRAPAGLTLPTSQEWRHNLYAGEPLSPLAYLLRYHSPVALAVEQYRGLTAIIGGRRFEDFSGIWLRLFCAAGVMASFASARARFAGLFIVSSVIGMPAHLMTVEPFELRLLLPVLIVWLACGWWLIAGLGELWLQRRQAAEPLQVRK